MNTIRLLLVLFGACALAGCPQRASRTSDVAVTPAPADAPASTEAIPTETSFIHGRATYPERIKMAPGADLTVQLIDTQLADAPAAVVATTTLEDVAGPPYDFALQYDPAKIRPDGRYALHASLRGADGSLLFVTDTGVPVTPGDARVVGFRMVRVGSGDAPPAPAQVNRTRWTCGDASFEAAFDIPGRRVDLALPDGTLSLPLAVSASGARYADHRGNEFWTKGDTGTLTRAGGSPLDCVQSDARMPAGTPWDMAKARGIAFRAIGNEPGWLVEIGPGERPSLHAELDYGERRLDLPAMQALSGLLGYAGTSPEGAHVRLVLERRACSDGMSDARYPVVATLEVDTHRYNGCGRFLAE